MKIIQAFKKAWFEYYDNIMSLEKEVFDIRKDLQETHYNHLSNLIDELERYANLQEDQYEKEKEHYDYLISSTQAILDIKKAQFNLENNLASARREAEKALASSKIGTEYLDEETRKLVYNDEDYKLEIDKIKEISDYVDERTKDYISEINSLDENEIYKAEEITAQYERRLALKEKELEIVQAEVDLQKKQSALDNVLAEKNIRQIVNGKWTWTNDTDKLRQATEDLADAEAEISRIRREKEQLEYTNTLEARIGRWELEQNAIDSGMNHLKDKIDEFSKQLDLLKSPLKNFEEVVNELNAKLGGIETNIKISTASVGGKRSSSNSSVESVVKQMMGNSTMWHVVDSATKEQLHATNKLLASSIGATYNPSDGKYYQNGKPLYDSGGILKGLGGIKATRDDEAILSPSLTNNILNPEKNAMFDMFTKNLATIFTAPISQANMPQMNLGALNMHNGNSCNTYQMNGDVHITEAENIDKVLTTIINKIKSMPNK